MRYPEGINVSFDPLPGEEFARRVTRVQEELEKEGLDVLVGYSSECESAASRYLTGFWPFFDFAAVIVPAIGSAVLVTGGPESFEFAKAFSQVPQIEINPLLVESSPPDWVPTVCGKSFSTLLPKVCGRTPKRVGVANWNIFPHVLFEDLKAGAPHAEFVPADDILLRVQAVKSDVEIPCIVEAYRITEEAMKTALAQARPGRREWELEAVARSKMLELGAEGMSYPAWVCSGPMTPLSLCRSTNRAIQAGELVQFTFGAKFMGYCGNMCRPFSIGQPPAKARKLMDVALEAMEYALASIRPEVRACEVFAGYYKILARHGFEKFTLYGPAHGTGSSEVEGLWLAEKADFVIQPNMLFNVDIWLSDGDFGVRYEDGILVTQTGIRELTRFRREVIAL
jgi:Xaa-Pro aminopeptidase